jgi:hypothetical protein
MGGYVLRWDDAGIDAKRMFVWMVCLTGMALVAHLLVLLLTFDTISKMAPLDRCKYIP